MKRIHARELSRRAMLCRTAAASGLAGIFTMSASGQQAGAPAQAQTGRGAAGGLGGRGGVHYGPINKFSSPSDLRITDIRALRIAANFDYPVIKIFTNQDVYGLGEVRDAGNENLALGMKPLLVGRNPLDISGILQTVRPYAGAGRQGGGFSAIIALEASRSFRSIQARSDPRRTRRRRPRHTAGIGGHPGMRPATALPTCAFEH
jgi:hypothetical protein